MGEEGCSGDANAEFRWVVDPIDGTVNYFFGMPHACVSIALQRRSGKVYQTVLGVIYDPFTDELWTAVQGGKTRLNGRIVRVSQRGKIGEAVVAMGFSKSKENLEKSLPQLLRLARTSLKVRLMGSAALELAYVASGRLDLYVERTINLWDIAAGALMVECSGGECWLKNLPDGRYRMCADNGLLRKKLQLGSLLK
ncbi:MAG: inositol monophosphatase family protein [Limisphaerales bacterium]